MQNTLPEEKDDADIMCVAHDEFMKLDVRSLTRDGGVVYDVKGVLDKSVIDARL